VDPFPSTPVARAKPLTFDCQPFIKSRVADAETLQQIAAVERCGAPKITGLFAGGERLKHYRVGLYDGCL
jgi:hypothetical protein